MRIQNAFLAVTLIASASIPSVRLSALSAPRPGVDWPQFRGIDAGGVASFATATTWNI